MKINIAAPLRARLFCALILLCSTGVSAVDFNVSGFGTLGYAAVDEDLRYLRFIDKGGTLKTDSLFGVQVEAQFNSQWGATLQAVATPSLSSDQGQEVSLRWAFVSFRPDNDWLLRVGRLRPPFFVHSQNSEVGVTFDQVRLPAEVYTLIPVFDVNGVLVTKTWALDKAELSLDAYWGKIELNGRGYRRDTMQASYGGLKLETFGLIASYTTDSLLLRAGANRGYTRLSNGQPLINTFAPSNIPAPPPLGGTLFLPSGSPFEIDFTLFTFGVDWYIDDWRITGEFAQFFAGIGIGSGSKNSYVTVARQIGKWTPYVTQARVLSDSATRNLFDSVNSTPVPTAVQGAPAFLSPNFHRTLADAISLNDQYSTALGTSYSFSPTSKAKFEWMRTRVRLSSNMVDGDISNKSFNVFSVSYSVAF